MKKQIRSKSISHGGNLYFEVEVPGICPRCSIGIEPRLLSSYYLEHSNKGTLSNLYFCPRCEQTFICEYDYSLVYLNAFAARLLPSPSETIIFKKEITALSPNFTKIYNQSYLAEQQNLDEICGIGYRKSLEFLVKDFALYSNQNDEETIKSLSLAQCIDKYIDNPRIKTLAKASTWLGNDETHYQRKHENYNINNLKTFIEATVSALETELIYNQATILTSPK